MLRDEDLSVPFSEAPRWNQRVERSTEKTMGDPPVSAQRNQTLKLLFFKKIAFIISTLNMR